MRLTVDSGNELLEPASGPGGALDALELPPAPPVTRVTAAPVRRPRLPALALLVLGALLILAPIAGGLFSRVAAGKQMVDRFAPYLTPDTLARYDSDITILRRAAGGVDEVYSKQHVAVGRFPGLDEYRVRSDTINGRAESLLGRVRAARPDYLKVAAIGGFDRIPFLVVAGGAVAVYGGMVLRFGARGRARPTALLVTAVSALVVAYPFASGFENGAASGRRMMSALSPVMTAGQVRQLQDDFVVLVTAVGELDTSFRAVPQSGPAAVAIRALVTQWPSVSSDLASLVGTINDNVSNFDALKGLDSLTSDVGISGLEAFPWFLVGVGAASVTLSVAALPRRRKEIR